MSGAGIVDDRIEATVISDDPADAGINRVRVGDVQLPHVNEVGNACSCQSVAQRIRAGQIAHRGDCAPAGLCCGDGRGQANPG